MAYSEKTNRLITSSIIMNYLALFFNERVKNTGYYKRNQKKILGNAITMLSNGAATDYLAMDTRLTKDGKLESLEAVTDNIFDVTETLAAADPENYIFLTNVVLAWKKDPKRMQGLAKKILDN